MQICGTVVPFGTSLCYDERISGRVKSGVDDTSSGGIPNVRQILRLFLVLLLALAVSSGVRGTGYAQDASYLDSAIDRLETMSGTSFSASGAGGADDDQQVPDNQQGGGGGAEITKTFELTLNGTPSADQGFVAVSIAVDPENDSVLFFSVVEFCGEVPDVSAELDQLEAELEADGIDVTVEYIQNDDPCTGDGTVYAESVMYPAGVQAFFSFIRLNEDQVGETVFKGEETLDSDMTNTAFYDFGSTGADDDQKDTGAGDDQQTPDNQQDDTQDDGTGAGDDQQTPDNQQDDTQDDGTGAGDDQQTPHNQQDDTQDDGTGAGDTQDDTQDDGAGAGDTQDDSTGGGDIQDDQQGETPEELPATGAGGMAPVGLPVGGVLTALAAVAALGLRLMHR